MTLRLTIILLLLAFFLLPQITAAHPGGTDKYGCHTCKTNCASWGLKKGEYHCHKSKGKPQPKPAITTKKLR